MKNKYIPVYKCQLCGLHISQHDKVLELEESEVFYLMGAIMNNQQFIGTKDYKAPIKIPHRCWNGSVGYCDLAGFKKIKEKKK